MPRSSTTISGVLLVFSLLGIYDDPRLLISLPQLCSVDYISFNLFDLQQDPDSSRNRFVVSEGCHSQIKNQKTENGASKSS